MCTEGLHRLDHLFNIPVSVCKFGKPGEEFIALWQVFATSPLVNAVPYLRTVYSFLLVKKGIFGQMIDLFSEYCLFYTKSFCCSAQKMLKNNFRLMPLNPD